jgi:hypothetical protein
VGSVTVVSGWIVPFPAVTVQVTGTSRAGKPRESVTRIVRGLPSSVFTTAACASPDNATACPGVAGARFSEQATIAVAERARNNQERTRI